MRDFAESLVRPLNFGRTTVLQGAVHLVIFVFFLFTSFLP